jgi:RNA polymerase sigma factor (sigma-70 family)
MAIYLGSIDESFLPSCYTGLLKKTPHGGVFIKGMRRETHRMGSLGPETVTRIWDEHGPALVLYAQQWCDTPEDVVQEAFLLLVRQPLPPENPVGWMYRVVRNRAINASRSGGRRSRREATTAAHGEPWFETTDGDRLDAAAATEALKHLPIEQREAIVARLWGGLGFEEIATISGSSTSTVFRCYQRGLEALRERLGWPCLAKPTKTKLKTKN